MIPAQRNKVDIGSLSEEEQKLFRLYGKLPTRKDVVGNKLKERKYFDSGDYALSKAGKATPQSVGTAIPNPETIPHASTVSSSTSPSNGMTSGVPSSLGGSASAGLASSPVNVPSNATGPLGPLGHRNSLVSAFPTATGFSSSGSPTKEGGFPSGSSGLARNEVGADDLMEE